MSYIGLMQMAALNV